jgi:hypothetical protein
VEHRKEPRLKANQSVIVTALGLMPPMSGRVLDMSGSGLRLRLPNPVPCGSPVKVESQRMMMLGEVSRCEGEAEGYAVGLMLIHTSPIAAKLGRVIIGG